MENEIPTAKEFLDELLKRHVSMDSVTEEELEEGLREFTKLHTEAALKAASEEASMTSESWGSMQEGTLMVIDKESILSAYPLDQIK